MSAWDSQNNSLNGIAAGIAGEHQLRDGKDYEHVPMPSGATALEAEVASWFYPENDTERIINESTIEATIKTIDGQIHKGELLSMDNTMGCTVFRKDIGHEPDIFMNSSIISITIHRADTLRGLFK